MATSDSFTAKTTLEQGIVFTLTWKIDNISLYTGEMATDLSSPFFEIGTQPTKFQIYLNSGPWSAKKIWARTSGDIGNWWGHSNQISELTLLRDDGGVIESFDTHLFLHCCGKCLYPNPTLFSNDKVLSLFLPKNSLTIRWKIYNIGSGERFFRTVFHQKIFRWNIRDFSKRPTFTKLVQLSSQYLRIDLSKLQQSSSMKIIMVKFIPSDQDSLNFGNCTITAIEKEIIYRYGKVNILHNKHIPPTIQSYEDSKVSNKIPPWSWEAPVMLDSGVCKLIKNDTLILQWDIIVGIDEIWNGNDPHTNPKVTTCPTVADTLQSDLLRLYEDKKFCDATLKTRNAIFPVHKSVLCARSPVFCAMFESDTKEARTGIVHIQDIRPDTLEQMLFFMYKDSLGDNMSWEMAAGLYYAADKYRIQALKDRCVSVLIEKLSVANVCEALLLADTHQDEVLMQAVKDFVFDHDEVVCSVQWTELEKKNPPLAVQFFRDMYLKKKT